MKYLRTLTGKSTLQFGRFAETPIQQIIDAGHTGYLRWIYFNFSFINFTEDILNNIYVFEQWTISKPGKDSDKGQKLDNLIFARMGTDMQRYKTLTGVRKNKRRNYYNVKKADEHLHTKGIMAWKNQGHK
jgi:hypothetical protein